VSVLGSRLTAFGLPVYILQRTGSVESFALLSFFGVLPASVLAPLAGQIVDRWNRRTVMMASNAASAAVALVLAALLASDRLELWNACGLVAAAASLETLHALAYSAATTLLVPREQLGHAAGLVELGQAAGRLVAPALAGVLLLAVGLGGLVLIDFATFLFALVTLSAVRIPAPDPSDERPGPECRGGAGLGWRFIAARPGLAALLAYFTGVNFLVELAGVLFVPLVLELASPARVGVGLSVAGAAALAGSLALSAWGGPRRRVLGVLLPVPVVGVCIALAGLRPPFAAVVALGALAYGCLPIVVACGQALWQRHVPALIQGRVFAVRRMIALSSPPLAALLAVPLASSLGGLVGSGQGSGVGPVFIGVGASLVLAPLVARAYAPLRQLDDEAPGRPSHA
jgi:MFS family permease